MTGEPLPRLSSFGSGHGDKIVYCEDCTVKGGKWMLDTVYGDEGDA